MIDNPDPIADRLRADLAVPAVGSDADNNRNPAVGQTGLIQMVDEKRQGELIVLPGPGNIAYDDNNAICGLDDFLAKVVH